MGLLPEIDKFKSLQEQGDIIAQAIQAAGKFLGQVGGKVHGDIILASNYNISATAVGTEIPNFSTVFRSSGGVILVFGQLYASRSTAGNNSFFQMVIDGKPVKFATQATAASTHVGPVPMFHAGFIGSGQHRVHFEAWKDGGIGTVLANYSNLTIVELLTPGGA